MPQISQRLLVIAEKIPLGDNVCDVGTDHGYLPAFLQKSEKYGKISATDIREKPLNNARENLEKLGVNGVELVLCNGLEKIERKDADTVIIAGMGGEVISGIMERCAFLKEGVTLILQPMTAAGDLRIYLCQNGFEILEETAVEENKKIYTVIKAKYNGNRFECSPLFARVGKIKAETALGRKYIEKQLLICNNALTALKTAPEKEKEYTYFNELAKSLLDLLEE